MKMYISVTAYSTCMSKTHLSHHCVTVWPHLERQGHLVNIHKNIPLSNFQSFCMHYYKRRHAEAYLYPIQGLYSAYNRYTPGPPFFIIYFHFFSFLKLYRDWLLLPKFGFFAALLALHLNPYFALIKAFFFLR